MADCLNGDGEDDARRIVACVNACEGIADPESFIGASRGDLADRMIAERDHLVERVAELGKLLQECLDMSDNWPGIAYSYDLESRIKSVLAKELP